MKEQCVQRKALPIEPAVSFICVFTVFSLLTHHETLSLLADHQLTAENFASIVFATCADLLDLLHTMWHTKSSDYFSNGKVSSGEVLARVSSF